MNGMPPPPGWEHEPPHLLIRASAGSGKTYRLSSRYLSLIARRARPESILATTFTRKAAGEVLARVITRLADAADQPSNRTELSDSLPDVDLTAEDCSRMLRLLVGSMHKLSISTIDGFFHKIARCFAYELGLPPEPALVDESHPTAVRLRRDAVDAMLGDSDLTGLVTLLRQFHHDHASRRVTEAIDDILSEAYEVYREAPDPAVWSRLQPSGFLDEDAIRSAVDRLLDTAGELPDGNKSWLKGFATSREAALARDWDRFLNAGLGKAVAFNDGVFYQKPIGGALRAALDPLADHAKATLLRRVALQTEATHDLMRRFDKQYAQLRQSRGLLLFSDLTHKLARELPQLGDGLVEDLYFRLDAHVTHLLLDEFQDTSLAQWDVLQPFALEAASTYDGERSGFVVGDTKQAIYGWRGGVAELFDTLEQQLMLGEENIQTMAKSYRSSRTVLDAVNTVFAPIAENPALKEQDQTAAERWANGFKQHTAARDIPGYITLETSAASVSTQSDSHEGDARDGADDENAPANGAHERYVAQRVKALYERPGSAGSIGVLVRTNQTGNRLIYEIGLLGVPVSGEGGGSLTDTPATLAFLSALTMADHPGDSASVFHVLHSPLAEVLGIDSNDPKAVRAVALKIRTQLLTEGYAQTLADWTRKVAPSCDPRGLTRLSQLIDLAEAFEPGDALRPSRFVALAESKRVPEPSPAAVRVMTIHGSKGLEFDTVVLAELDKAFRHDPKLLIERATPTGPITGVYRNADKAVRTLDPDLEKAYQAGRDAGLMDFFSLLYVGMTRPRQALHMIVKPRELTRKGALKSLGLSYAAILRSAYGIGDEPLEGGQCLYEQGDPSWACTSDRTQTSGTVIQSVPDVIALDDAPGKHRRFLPTVAPSDLAHAVRSAKSILDLSAGQDDAMRYGTLIHVWFEAVGFIDEAPLPDRAKLRSLTHQHMPNADAGWLDGRIDWFLNLLQTETARQVLARHTATDLWRERRFVVHDGRELIRGGFDRVTVHRDASGRASRAVLLDYKTDTPPEDGIGPLVQRYKPQLLAYRRALTRLLALPPGAVEMQAWFVGANTLCRVEP